MRFGQGSRARALRVLDSRCVCVRIHPRSRTHARTLPLLLLLLPVLVPVLLLPVLLQIIGRPQLSAPYSYWPPDGLGQRALVRV